MRRTIAGGAVLLLLWGSALQGGIEMGLGRAAARKSADILRSEQKEAAQEPGEEPSPAIDITVATAEALRAVVPERDDAIARTLGAISSWDGGGGFWRWAPESVAEDTLGTVLKPTGHEKAGRWVRDWSGMANARWFGAAGDGTTDDTAALQRAIDTIFGTTIISGTRQGGHLLLPLGKYRITAPLVIDGVNSWRLHGDSRNGTLIEQDANNVAILELRPAANTMLFGFELAHMRLRYKVMQPIGNVGATAVLFFGTETQANIFNSVFQDLAFNNCRRCFSTSGNARTQVWGIAFRDIDVDATCTGSFFRNQLSVSAGQPLLEFDGVYIRADKIAESVFFFQATSANMQKVEVNSFHQGPPVLEAVAGSRVVVEQLAMETVKFLSPDSSLFILSDSDLIADRIDAGAITVDVGAGNRALWFRRAGVAGTIIIQSLKIHGTNVISGRPLILYGGGGNENWMVKIVAIETSPGYPGWNPWVLSDLSNTAAAVGVQLECWNDDSLSADVGDKDKTITVGSENVLLFNSNLTADRDVILPPEIGDCDTFDGLRYRVVRTGGGTGTLRLKRPNGVVLGSLIGKGAMEASYKRLSWALIDYSTW